VVITWNHPILWCIWVVGLKFVQIHAVYKIYIKPGFLSWLYQHRPGVSSEFLSMPQINMIPNPVILYWHWDNQFCALMVNVKQGSNRCRILSIWP